MITIHNLQNGVAKQVVSSIVYESQDVGDEKVVPSGVDGWQAYSGKSTITWPSPAATSETETSPAGRLKESTMDNVNRARMVDIAIGIGTDDLARVVAKTGETNLLSASEFGNWRKKSRNKFTDISKRVMLNLTGGSNPKANYKITYGTETLGKVVKDNTIAKTITKLSSTVNDLAAVAGAVTGNDELTKSALTGERISRYQDMPVLDLSKVSTDGGLSSLEFTFSFGQAGIFSGEEEVVKPILALVTPFALSTGEGYHSITGPMPTLVTANRKAMLTTMDIVKNALGGGSLKLDTSIVDSGGTGAAGLVQKFNAATDMIYQAMDEIAESLWPLTTTLTAIIGGVVLGPFTVGGISWEFDFENVDEYGYPCKGKLTYDSLKPIRMYTGSDYARQWGYKVGETTDMDSITKAQLVENALNKSITAAEINGATVANDSGRIS